MPCRVFGAVAALLLSPLAAAAGPIGWSYDATISPPNGSFAYFGTEYQLVGTSDPVAVPYLIVGNVDRVAWGSGSGAQTIRVGSIGMNDLGAYSTTDPWASGLPSGFALSFTLTDAASQQSATLTYQLNGWSSGFFDWSSGTLNVADSVILQVEDRTDSLRLGQTVYTVHAVIPPTGGGSAAAVDVQVTAAPAVPEPGTLALAGAGLGVLRLTRRRVLRPAPTARA